jgi:hypothetical protein
MLRVSQLKSNGWVKGTIAAVLGHTPVCGIRGKAAKIMWRVSLELDPIMGGFFKSVKYRRQMRNAKIW